MAVAILCNAFSLLTSMLPIQRLQEGCQMCHVLIGNYGALDK